MSEVQLSLRAYAKILSHVVQFPYTAVNGVLLTVAGDDLEDKEEDRRIDIVDAVPLFHYNISLTPMLTVALTQIEEYATNRSLKIAGYYHANEYCNDSEVNSLSCNYLTVSSKWKLSEQLESYLNPFQAVILVQYASSTIPRLDL